MATMKHIRPRCEVCGGAQGYSPAREALVCVNDYCPSRANERAVDEFSDSLAVAIRWGCGIVLLAVLLYAAFRHLFP